MKPGVPNWNICGRLDTSVSIMEKPTSMICSVHTHREEDMHVRRWCEEETARARRLTSSLIVCTNRPVGGPTCLDER
jgi:hypothetical protein